MQSEVTTCTSVTFCANVVELLLASVVRALLLSRKELLGEGVLKKLYITVGPLTAGLF